MVGAAVAVGVENLLVGRLVLIGDIVVRADWRSRIHVLVPVPAGGTSQVVDLVRAAWPQGITASQ